MKFLHYNLKKILFIGSIVYLACVLALLLTGLTPEIGPGLVVSLPLLPAFIAMGVFGIRGAYYFKSMDSMLADHTENSVTSLFEGGHEVYLRDEDSKVYFTQEQLRTTIKGLPVTITYSKESRTKRLVVTFSFYPLIQPGTSEPTAMRTSYYAGMRYALPKDLRQRVLQYVEELKRQGFSAANSPASHTIP